MTKHFGRANLRKGGDYPQANPPEPPHEPNVPPTAIPSSAVNALNKEPSEGLNQQRERKTAAELAEMIEADLARLPGCPEAGF
jgi:hypothetical protein